MIAETIARLRDQAPTFKLIGGAAEFDAAAQNNPKAAPAAYVLRFADRGHPQETVGPPDQRVDAEIGVVYAVRNLTDSKGEAAGADMEALRAAGRGALLGWVPPGCDPLQFGAGNLLAFKDGYTRALILTGNAAGTTASQMSEAAQRVAAAAGGTKGAAAEALALAASTAAIAAESLDAVATAAVSMERATGKAIEDTVAEFEKLARNPVAASLKLNEQYRYLTAETYRQIKALEDQGRATDAAALAMKTYADAMNERAGQIQQNLGTLERGWNAVALAGKKGWDAMLDIGRKDSLAEKIDAAEKRVQVLQNSMRALGSKSAEKDLPAAQAELVALKAPAAEEKAVAEAKRKVNEQNQAGVKWITDANKYLTEQKKLENEISKIRTEGAAAGISPEDIEKRVAKASAAHARAIAGARGEVLVEAARGNAKRLTESYQQDLEAFRLSAADFAAKMAAAERQALLVERNAVVGQRPTDTAGEIKKAGRLAEIDKDLAEIGLKYERVIEDVAQKRQAAQERMDAELGKAARPDQRAFAAMLKDYGKELREASINNDQEALGKLFDIRTQRENAGNFGDMGQQFATQVKQMEAALAGTQIGVQLGALTDDAKAFADHGIRASALPGLMALRAKMAEAADGSGPLKLALAEIDKQLADVGVSLATPLPPDNIFDAAASAAKGYLASIGSVARQQEQMFANSFRGMEGVLTQFFETGKANARDFGNVIRHELANMAAKQVTGVLSEGVKLGGGWLKSVLAPANHTGGIAGAEATFMRTVSPSVFAGAPRLHGGGIAGDEVPTILRKGEGVFTAGQMRAMAPAGGAPQSIRVEVVNPPGRPAEVASAIPRFDPEGMVLSIIMRDARDRGPISQTLETTFGLRR